MTRQKGFPEIGKRLLSVRGEQDQRGFSRQVDVSQQAVSNYERGNLPASWGFLRKLAEDFNVSLDWLITGQGRRDFRAGTPYASLTDNRPNDWAQELVEQCAFVENDPLDLLLPVYFLYMATEPADAKARLMSDYQAIVGAVLQRLDQAAGPERETLGAVCDALGRDDRRAAVNALIAEGERRESAERARGMPSARRAYLAALAVANVQLWLDVKLEAARRVARTFRKQGRWQEAEAWFRRVLERYESQEAGEENGDASVQDHRLATVLARTMLGYGHVAKFQGDLVTTRERYTAALRWALKTPDPGLRAEIYVDLACLSYHEHEWEKALDYAARGRIFAEEAGDRRHLNECRMNEGLVFRETRDLEKAQQIFEALLEEAEASGDVWLTTLSSHNLAMVLADRGESDPALRLLERTQASALANGNPRYLALRELLLARIEAAKGEEGTARARLLSCMRYARDHGLAAQFDEAAADLQGLAAHASSAAAQAG